MSLYVDIEKQLGNFSLNVKFESGNETLGLLGASGSGKSMTLKCIAGIEKPDKGKIVLDGRTLFDSEQRINIPPQGRHVGYLFQNYALFPNMTVKGNIMCGLHRVRDKAERSRILAETLELFQLTELADNKPDQLSGGEAQRTALARILVNRPEILMLDEPFSALDHHLRLRLQMQLRDLLQHFGKGVLMVTHDRNEAYRMCSRIAMIHEGKILTVKGTQEFFADPGSIPAAVMSGCKNIVAAHKAGDYQVKVPEWNVLLTTQQKVRDGLVAIGIRAHYFNPSCTQNRHVVEFVREMEEPFESIFEFRFKSQTSESQSVWWRIPKDMRPAEFPAELGIAESNILLLY